MELAAFSQALEAQVVEVEAQMSQLSRHYHQPAVVVEVRRSWCLRVELGAALPFWWWAVVEHFSCRLPLLVVAARYPLISVQLAVASYSWCRPLELVGLAEVAHFLCPLQLLQVVARWFWI